MGETLALIVWSALAFFAALLWQSSWAALGWSLAWGIAVPVVMVGSAWIPELRRRALNRSPARRRTGG